MKFQPTIATENFILMLLSNIEEFINGFSLKKTGTKQKRVI